MTFKITVSLPHDQFLILSQEAIDRKIPIGVHLREVIQFSRGWPISSRSRGFAHMSEDQKKAISRKGAIAYKEKLAISGQEGKDK